MEHFLSCDWGTSSFRLRLIEAGSLKVLAEVKSGEGIGDTYKKWAEQSAVDRQQFYTQIIAAQINRLGAYAMVQKTGVDLKHLPVILSGMASSSIGLIDIPYKELPFRLDGSDLNVQVLRQHVAENPMIIVSGAKTDNDVIRGEETKVVGCAPYLAGASGEVQLILPGTHPKHILIKGRQATGFKTYMTGEFFDLLAGLSILSASVQEGGDLDDPGNRESFVEGVKAARGANLLHAAFMVRTRQVLHHTVAAKNYHYLSGLLIGYELKEVKATLPVFLVGGSLHMALYSLACAVLDIPIVRQIDADEALIRGQEVIHRTWLAG